MVHIVCSCIIIIFINLKLLHNALPWIPVHTYTQSGHLSAKRGSREGKEGGREGSRKGIRICIVYTCSFGMFDIAS